MIANACLCVIVSWQPGSDSARLLFAGQRDQAANPDVLLPDVLDDAEMNELELIVERVNEIAQAAAEMRVLCVLCKHADYFLGSTHSCVKSFVSGKLIIATGR